MADSEAPRSNDTYLRRLQNGEQHVFWKLSFRLIIMALNLVAIGAAAWTLDNRLVMSSNPYIGYFSGPEIAPWVLIVASVSFVFCLVCILVLLLRKPPRPAHPGIAVGCDLVLWLAFIVTGLFSVVSIFYIADFSRDTTTMSDPSYASDYSGEYYLADNGTWVYNVTYVSPYSSSSTDYGDYFYNYTRNDWQKNTTKPVVHRDCSEYFASCVQQDAYVNELWSSRHQRFGTEVAATAAQWLNVIFHFVLFVWACVDTHRKNRATRSEKVDAVAERVIRDMEAKGLITVHGRAAEGQPLMSENRGVSDAGTAGGGSNEAGPSTAR